jgi:hypothetical protein
MQVDLRVCEPERLVPGKAVVEHCRFAGDVPVRGTQLEAGVIVEREVGRPLGEQARLEPRPGQRQELLGPFENDAAVPLDPAAQALERAREHRIARGDRAVARRFQPRQEKPDARHARDDSPPGEAT